MATSGGSITLRLALVGSEEVKAALASLGPAGANALRQIEAAQAGPNAGLRALSALSEEAQGKLRGFAEGVGPLAGAMTALGPAGLAAAAGIGAAIAVGAKIADMAVKTAEWAEATEHFARLTGQSTTAVQEFDFAFTALGIPVEQGRAALEGLGKVIGTLQDNMSRSKAAPQVRLFEAILGTDDAAATQAKLRQLGDIQHILPLILDYVAKFPATEREGFARALRIDPEVLNTLADGRDKIAGLIAEAHEYGIVVDESLVKQSAAAAEKLHVAGAVAEGELRVAMAHLAPEISAAADAFAHAVKGIADFIAECKDAVGPIEQLIARLQSIPHDVAVALHIPTLNLSPTQQRQMASNGDFSQDLGNPVRMGMRFVGQLAQYGRLQQTKAGIQNLLAGGHYDGPTGDGDDQAPAGPPPKLPTDADAGKKAAPDRDASAEAEAKRKLLDAEIKAAADLDTQHALRLQLIDADRDQALAAAKKKGLSPTARSDLEQAADLTHTADVKAEGIRYAKEQDDHARQVGDLAAKYRDQQLKAEADLAGTLTQRQALARAELAETQARDRQDLASNDKLTLGEQALAQYQQERAQAAQRTLLAAQQSDELAAAAARQDELSLQSKVDLLKAQAALTKTMGKRRDLELVIFDLEEQDREAKLQAIVASETAKPEDRVDALIQLDSLRATAPLRRQAVSEANPGNPFTANLQRMQAEVQPLDQEFGAIAADGLNKFNQGLVLANGQFANLGQLARKTFADMLVSLEQYLIKQAEIGILGNGQAGSGLFGAAFGAGGAGGTPGATAGATAGINGSLNNQGLLGALVKGAGGVVNSGVGGLFNSLGDGFNTGYANLLGLAGGGTTDGRKRPRPPAEGALHEPRVPGFAGGGHTGYLRGPGTTTSDSILIAGSDKEYVVNAAATARYLPLLDAINDGRPIRGFAAGGFTGPSSPTYQGPLGTGDLHFHNPVYISAPGADAAQLQRVETGLKQWQRGEPQRFAAYNKAMRRHGPR
jgi:hypothetical protein